MCIRDRVKPKHWDSVNQIADHLISKRTVVLLSLIHICGGCACQYSFFVHIFTVPLKLKGFLSGNIRSVSASVKFSEKFVSFIYNKDGGYENYKKIIKAEKRLEIDSFV